MKYVGGKTRIYMIKLCSVQYQTNKMTHFLKGFKNMIHVTGLLRGKMQCFGNGNQIFPTMPLTQDAQDNIVLLHHIKETPMNRDPYLHFLK